MIKNELEGCSFGRNYLFGVPDEIASPAVVESRRLVEPQVAAARSAAGSRSADWM